MAPMRLALLAVPALVALAACTADGPGRTRRPGPPAEPMAPGLATVPDVRGLGVEAARASVERAGFLVGAVQPWPDALGYPAGTVVAQRPAHGTTVASGTAVELRVYGLDVDAVRRATADASPPPTPPPPTPPPRTPPSIGLGRETEVGVVPDLVGRTLAEATTVARAAGFEVV